MIKEPKRLIEGPGELAESLAAAQRRLPSDARLAALSARLASNGVLLSDPVPSPLAPGPARLGVVPKAPLELSMKVVLSGVVLGALAIGGALAYRQASPTARTSGAPAQVPAERIAERARGVGAPELGSSPSVAKTRTPSFPAAAGARDPDVTSSRAADIAERDVAVTAANSAVGGPSSARVRADSAEGRLPVRSAEAVPKRAALKAPGTGDVGALSAPAPSLPETTVVPSEVELLKQARNALGSDSLEAFALSERCRAQYPNGAFAQEREFIAISALVRLGRREDARSRASLFRTHYRNSAYLPQLTRMLGEE